MPRHIAWAPTAHVKTVALPEGITHPLCMMIIVMLRVALIFFQMNIAAEAHECQN
jgi:hypothetical protein